MLWHLLMFNYNNNDITLWSKFEEEINYIKNNNYRIKW